LLSLETIIQVVNVVALAHLALIFFAICVRSDHQVEVKEPNRFIAVTELLLALIVFLADLWILWVSIFG
jgi:hypothetical protein